MDFISGLQLLELCTSCKQPIWNIMLEREVHLLQTNEGQIKKRLKQALDIMEKGTHASLQKPLKSMSGVIGGEAKKLYSYGLNTLSACGGLMSKAVSYALSMIEVNASMGLIVAAPTAGSCGIIPGCLFALKEEYNLTKADLEKGLLTASAIGYLITRNATVSGAKGGCQAEVGSASAMAAAGIVEMLGGTPEAALHAASIALSNLMGLICDPVAGLVEAPCQNRNGIGTANAMICAETALSGIVSVIPFDETVHAMYQVGESLPREFRETALGGIAATPTGCQLCKTL